PILDRCAASASLRARKLHEAILWSCAGEDRHQVCRRPNALDQRACDDTQCLPTSAQVSDEVERQYTTGPSKGGIWPPVQGGRAASREILGHVSARRKTTEPAKAQRLVCSADKRPTNFGRPRCVDHST